MLTDPRVFSGIGNAYSDEILHRARLSPVKQSQALDAEEIRRLCEATRTVLTEWIERLRQESGDGFPEGVTAFRPAMAVHGRYGKPCLECGTPVQRIVYADNETNYCARCQTGGRLLADRSLSRLLHARLAEDGRRVGGAAPAGRLRARSLSGIEERHGLAGALRTAGGLGGHIGAPHEASSYFPVREAYCFCRSPSWPAS